VDSGCFARLWRWTSPQAEFSVNGTRQTLDVEPRRTLADALREDLGQTGTHLGCEHGV
jgi:carbon-monoxide dehydrogenase small subunit